MNALTEQDISCPYCGENSSILLDCSTEEEQQYIEDCQVCCRPINFNLQFSSSGAVELSVSKEDDN